MRSLDLISAPIGLGPLGKAQAFSRVLAGDFNTRFVLDRSLVDAAQCSALPDSSSVSYCKRGEWNEFLQEHTLPSALVSFMEPSALEPYSRRRVPTVFFDSLSCFDRLEDPRISNCDLVIQQCFAADAAQREIIQRSAQDEGFELCAPLIEYPSTKRRVSLPSTGNLSVLIHIGGLGTPYVSRQVSERIGYEVSMIALTFLREIEIQHVTFAGAIPTVLQTMLTQECEIKLVPSIRFVQNRNDFLDEVGKSELVLTTPGLETVFETTALGRPIVLLPPVNFSQIHQFRTLSDAGVSTVSIGHSLLELSLEDDWRRLPNLMLKKLRALGGSSSASTKDGIANSDLTSSILAQESVLSFSSDGLLSAEEIFLKFLKIFSGPTRPSAAARSSFDAV